MGEVLSLGAFRGIQPPAIEEAASAYQGELPGGVIFDSSPSFIGSAGRKGCGGGIRFKVFAALRKKFTPHQPQEYKPGEAETTLQAGESVISDQMGRGNRPPEYTKYRAEHPASPGLKPLNPASAPSSKKKNQKPPDPNAGTNIKLF